MHPLFGKIVCASRESKTIQEDMAHFLRGGVGHCFFDSRDRSTHCIVDMPADSESLNHEMGYHALNFIAHQTSSCGVTGADVQTSPVYPVTKETIAEANDA